MVCVTAPERPARYRDAMVTITIERRWDGYTFLVNGRDDVVRDPVWGVTTYETEHAALEAAQQAVRALERAGTGRGHLS